MGKTAKKRKEKRGREFAAELEKHTEREKTLKEIDQLKDEELYEITDKSKSIKKRYPLDPLRFKRKMWKFLGKSKSEAKLVEKLKKKLATSKVDQPKKKEPEVMDLWGDAKPATGASEPKKSAKHFKSCLPAVVPPHPGQSYNPASADYKELLKRAIEFEKQKEQQDRKALETLQPQRALNLLQKNGEEPQPEPKAEIEPEAEAPMTDLKISMNKPVDDSKRKTPAQRNRERKAKELKRLDEAKKAEKKKLHDVNRLKEIMKEIKTEKAELEAKRKEKEEKEKQRLEQQKEGVVFGTKKIGRFKYEQHAVDFLLPEELPKKLAQIQTDEGSSVRNCYESILKRGLVQPPAEGKGKGRGKAKRKYKFTESRDDNNNEDDE